MVTDDHTESGFSDVELAAMKQRAAELREQAKGGTGSAKKQREAQACVDAIEGLEGSDRAVAERLHAIVTEVAPHLDPKTWYGFPSYARDGKVVVFFQPKSKFDTRYGSIGFNEEALLDEGVFWPTSFAVLEVTDAVEAQLRELVTKAAG
ncbi:iron chaperone [Marisediminicola sp. LYQ85]|uniref:iron chaperone n=1 Tax=Marisediminicola sp. LYQ85 TaxID=3391062 RepID=UPI00398398D9